MDEKEPERTSLYIKGDGSKVALKIRKPYWCEGEAQIMVNGEARDASFNEAGYYVIANEWTEDRVEIGFPCRLRIELTKDCPDVGAFAYGPYVLAVLSEEDKMLTLGESDVSQKKLVPLCYVDKEKYHTYHKVK